MTSSSTVVIQNLAYLVGAIVLAIVIGVAVWLRHRPRRSVDANVESFHRGLRALAPDSDRPVARPAGLRIQPPYAAPVAEEADEAELAEVPELPEPAGDDQPEHHDGEGDGDEEDEDHTVSVVDDAKPDDEVTDAGEPEAGGETAGAADVVDLSKQTRDTAAGEATGDWAGAETG